MNARHPIFFGAMFLLLTLLTVQGQEIIRTPQLTFATVDFPGAGATFLYGINLAADVVGVYGDDSGSLKHGFVMQGGVFKTIDYPGADSTVATGINDSGLIVGYANFGVRTLSFLYDGTTFIPFRDGADLSTYAYGINNAGWIVGAAGSPSTQTAFELHGGKFKQINVPGTYYYGYAIGINSVGDVVGYTVDGLNTLAYDYSRGKFQQIAFPGAQQTQARGINDNGTIVGWYGNGPDVYGFILLSGRYSSFQYPGQQTLAAAVNNSGQVAGVYTQDFMTYHGFIASPTASN